MVMILCVYGHCMDSTDGQHAAVGHINTALCRVFCLHEGAVSQLRMSVSGLWIFTAGMYPVRLGEIPYTHRAHSTCRIYCQVPLLCSKAISCSLRKQRSRIYTSYSTQNSHPPA